MLAPVTVCFLLAQDAGPRAKASDYPVHVAVSNLEIGAEYLLHSIPSDQGFIIAQDFLVIEVAIFPHGGAATIAPGQFTMRINGKKLLTPASPGMVAASIKYPDWETRPTATVQAGAGDGSVIFGTPSSVPRFPGDRRTGPTIPSGPDAESSNGIDQTPRKPLDQVVAEAALPDVRTDRTVKGCIYFQFAGKTKSIKKLELLFDGGNSATQATIPII